MSLSSRIALGKKAWAVQTSKPVKRVVRDSRGRLSEEWLVNGSWITPKG
jgi:hypothetical protein